MNEKQLQENSAVKNISYGIEGIFLGFLFFLLILLGLNYLRIISLNSLNPVLSFLPQKQQIVENNNTSIVNSTGTKSKGVLIAEEKAKKAGYSVAWAGDTEDGSGRAILASKERNINGWVDKFGWQQVDLENGLKDDYRAQGIFEKWEEISNSKDFYIVLLNPNTKNYIKTRIVFEKETLTKYVPENNADNRTRLEIESLSYDINLGENKIYKKIGYFYDLGNKEINDVIKKGDVITIANIYSRQKIDNKTMFEIPRDLNRIALAVSVIARRFNND